MRRLTIRNLDEKAYRALKVRAAAAGKTMGEVVNEAIRAYLWQSSGTPARANAANREHGPFTDDNEDAEELLNDSFVPVAPAPQRTVWPNKIVVDSRASSSR